MAENLINYDPGSGAFYICTPCPDEQRLFEAGWRSRTPGTLQTTVIDIVEPFAHLFSPALRKLMGEFDRQLAEIDDKTWERIVPRGETLLEHQKFTVRFAIGAPPGDSTAIGDAPGAGKTVVNAVLANFWHPQAWLIVCPSSMKYKWAKEIEKWTTAPYDLIEVCENKTAAEHIARIQHVRAAGKRYVMIVNYDIMPAFEEVVKNGFVWPMITFDESHRYTGIDSKRTLFALGDVLPRKRGNTPILFEQRLFTTATNMNRPIHLWPLLKACDPQGLGRDYYEFVNRYAYGGVSPKGHVLTNGARNVEELGYLIAKRFFVRHDIDHLLPPYREETLLLSPSQIVADAEKEMFSQLLADLDSDDDKTAAAKQKFRETLAEKAKAAGFAHDILDPATGTVEKLRLYQDTFVEHASLLQSAPVLFEFITKLRLATGRAKQEAVVEHIESLLDDNPKEPVVVMVHHRELVQALYDRFGTRSRKVVGGVSAKKRQAIVESFQAGEFPVFIGNIAAAGEGLTLTRSCYLVFGEVDWNATAMWQALKRVHRLTQARDVTICYILLDQSLDARLVSSYLGKRESIQELFRGAEIARQELVQVT